MRQAHPRRGRVHACDEGIQARTVGVTRHRRVGPRGQQQGLEQFLHRQLIAGRKAALSPPYSDVAERRPRHPHLLVQVAAFSTTRAVITLVTLAIGQLGIQAAAPQHLAGGRSGQHRSLGLHSPAAPPAAPLGWAEPAAGFLARAPAEAVDGARRRSAATSRTPAGCLTPVSVAAPTR